MTRRGFTLIELTIAIVLLAIGLLALAGALAQALRETTHARVAFAAIHQAEALADSAAGAGILSGTLARPGFTVVWQSHACPLGTCLRIDASVGADTLTMLARTVPP